MGTTRNVQERVLGPGVPDRATLAPPQQSLDLAKRLLADNEKRVQIGTMAPIDIVEARVRGRAQRRSRDRRGIGHRAGPGSAACVDTGSRLAGLLDRDARADRDAGVPRPAVNGEAVVRRALENRTDLRTRQKQPGPHRHEHPVLQEPGAARGQRRGCVRDVGRRRRAAESAARHSDGADPTRARSWRSVAIGSVLGDVFTNDFPSWTVGVRSRIRSAPARRKPSLAQARLQHAAGSRRSCGTSSCRSPPRCATSVRQVQTNQKRVDAARAARELAERRLEAEEKKFAAGIQTTFFVFQAQRDLAQARSNYLRAAADYAKSVVDLEAVQQAPLQGATVQNLQTVTGR